MITVQQVLDRPLADLRVSDLTGHGLAVRKLIGCIDTLPARGKALLKELVDHMEWTTPGVWETCPENQEERHLSPSAAKLGMLVGRSCRTIRRAYEDAEEMGLLTRHKRGWNTNRFTLDLAKLLELAQQSQAAREERRRAVLLAWQGGYQGAGGRFAPRPQDPATPATPAGAAEPDTAEPDTAPDDAGELLEAVKLTEEELRAAFDAFPSHVREMLTVELKDGRRLVAERGVPRWASLKATPRAIRAELGALCLAVHALMHGQEPDEIRYRAAGSLAGRLGAAWSQMGFGPIAYMLRDIAAFRIAFKAEWFKKARPRTWGANAEQALDYVRHWRQYLEPEPGAPLVDPDAAPADLRLDEAPGDAEEEGEPLDAGADADADDGRARRAELRAILDRRTRDVATWRGALEALPPLPKVSGPPYDPERRRVHAERLARQDLRRALEHYARAAAGARVEELQEALQRAERAAKDLGLAATP